MKRILTLLSLILVSILTVSAGERSEQQMRNAAISVLNRSKTRSVNSELKELMAKPKLKIYGYEDGGFAVVSKDDRFDGVIGYSDTKFSGDLPCGFKWWLDAANNVIENTKGQMPAKEFKNKIIKAGVSPLIKTKWGQEEPYNNDCAFIGSNGTKYQFVTGCVATAMAQIMNYHQFPTRGKGNQSYDQKLLDNGDTITFHYSVDFNNSIYDWDYMKSEYNSTNIPDRSTKAVSLLMKDCGISVKMHYNGNASSASNSDVPEALKDFFFYDESTNIYHRSNILYDKDNYSREQWLKMIYTELDEGRPILYGGSKEKKLNSSGHAFVIDGYDGSSGKVHINWGWNGYCDGDFDIDMLNPNSSKSYNFLQDMVLIVPGKDSGEDKKRTVNMVSLGGGSLYYGGANGTELRNSSKSFTVNKGDDVILYLKPDAGSVLKNLVVDGEDVTTQVANQEYKISDITRNISVSAEFISEESLNEELDINKNLSSGISSSMGSVINGYGNITMSIFLKNSNANAITITKLVAKHPITGVTLATVTDESQLGELKGNEQMNVTIVIHQDVTPTFEWYYSYQGNSYLYTKQGTDAKYQFVIESIGDGVTKYNGESLRNESKAYGIKNNYYSYTLYFFPDDGYKVGNLLINGIDRTARISSNNSYEESIVLNDVKVSVSYVRISEPEYDLSILSKGGGTVSYEGTKIRQDSKSYKLKEGASAVLTITPDEGYSVKSVMANGSNVVSKVSNNQYTVESIKENTAVEVEFVPNTYKLTYMVDGEEYKLYEMEYGTAITSEPAPKKEGYTFSGWSDIPKTMPDHDVTVTGTFTKNNDSGEEAGINESLSSGVTSVAKVVVGGYADVKMSVFLKNSHSDAINITQLIVKHPVTGETLTSVTDDNQLGELRGGEQKNVSIEIYYDVTPTLEWHYTYKGSSCIFTQQGTDVKCHFTIESTGNGVTKYNNESLRNESKTYDIKDNIYSYTLYFVPDEGHVVEKLLINGKDYTSKISDNCYREFAETRSVTISVSYAKQSSLSGDANGDGSVDVSDVVSIVNYILGKATDSFDKIAANVNGDESIDVADVVGVVNIILGKANKVRGKETSSMEITENDHLSLMGNERNGYSLSLTNEASYVAAQFDVRLSEGMELGNVYLNQVRCSNHELCYSKIGENLYRILVYNMNGTAFEGNVGELLRIEVVNGNELNLSDVKLVTDSEIVKHFAPLTANPTGITSIVGIDSPADIYSLDGRLVRRQAMNMEGLKKGMYVVNNQKIVVR